MKQKLFTIGVIVTPITASALLIAGCRRNTTARAATAMDSTKNGPAGGWE